MTDLEYNHLELLLDKLVGEVGTKVCLIPEYLQDGFYIGSYNKETGELQSEAGAANLREAVVKIKRLNQKM